MTLAVTEAGDPRAPTLVLVHGYPDSAAMWDPVVEKLSPRFHVVTYDTRGAGRSSAPGPARSYRLGRLVGDLAAVADATSPDRPVHLVGHDWGSVQGWEAVTTDRMAGRIASFTSMSGPCLDHAGWWIRGAKPRDLAVQALHSWYLTTFLVPGATLFWRFGGGRLVHRALVALGELPSGRRPSPTLGREGANGVKLYRANLARMVRPGERRTDVPVQVVAPDADAFVTPALLEAAERWAPDLRVHRVAGRHWLPHLAPDLVADLIATHASRSGAAPHPPGPTTSIEAPGLHARLTGLSWPPEPSRQPTTSSSHPEEAHPAVPLPQRSARDPRTDRVGRSRALRPLRLKVRRPRFGWDETPAHWVLDAQTTHTLNVLHLLLPAGERWFVDLYRPLVLRLGDPGLRQAASGFIGQESTHARAHMAVLDHLTAQGIDTGPFTRRVEQMFDRLLGDRPFGWRLPGPLQERWTAHRLALVAAIEHFTAAMGSWLLDAEGFDRLAPPADPVMVDLLRWHAAEEVEHRAVAFDLYEELAGGYAGRMVAVAQVVPVLMALWLAGLAYLMRHDPARPGKATWGGYRRAVEAGVLPSARTLAAMVRPYLRPGHHPATDGSDQAAVAYLARFEAVPAVP